MTFAAHPLRFPVILMHVPTLKSFLLMLRKIVRVIHVPQAILGVAFSVRNVQQIFVILILM